jgi:hypothetical protein
VILASFTVRYPFGLLVASSPESTDAHDGWDASTQMVHARPDSLYIGVKDAASGLVTVTCTEAYGKPSGIVLYDGKLTLPSARLRLYDPDENVSVVVPVSSSEVSVMVTGDDPEEPSDVTIQLRPL